MWLTWLARPRRPAPLSMLWPSLRSSWTPPDAPPLPLSLPASRRPPPSFQPSLLGGGCLLPPRIRSTFCQGHARLLTAALALPVTAHRRPSLFPAFFPVPFFPRCVPLPAAARRDSPGPGLVLPVPCCEVFIFDCCGRHTCAVAAVWDRRCCATEVTAGRRRWQPRRRRRWRWRHGQLAVRVMESNFWRQGGQGTRVGDGGGTRLEAEGGLVLEAGLQ